MRQLVCMSADVYCQILNNHQHENRHIYTQTERRGNGLDPRETERVCVCKRRRMAESRVGVRCKNGRWGAINYFGIV